MCPTESTLDNFIASGNAKQAYRYYNKKLPICKYSVYARLVLRVLFFNFVSNQVYCYFKLKYYFPIFYIGCNKKMRP